MIFGFAPFFRLQKLCAMLEIVCLAKNANKKKSEVGLLPTSPTSHFNQLPLPPKRKVFDDKYHATGWFGKAI